MITVIGNERLRHIEDRHRFNGSADSNFDAQFRGPAGGYGKIAKLILEHGDGTLGYDSSGTWVHKDDYNFNSVAGTGVDSDGRDVTFREGRNDRN
jgi:hypothetical protein